MIVRKTWTSSAEKRQPQISESVVQPLTVEELHSLVTLRDSSHAGSAC